MNSDALRRGLMIGSLLLLGIGSAAAAVLFDGGGALALSLVLAGMLGAMLVFSARRSEPAFITLTAVMTALSVVGRIAFAPFAGFKPCTAIIIITGLTLGAESGFFCGAFTALVSNIYFGQGLWTLYQMFSWGLIGMIAGLAAGYLLRHRAALLTFALLSGCLYSVLMDVFSTLWEDGFFNPVRFLALTATTVPYTISYAVSNVVFILLLGNKMIFSIERVKRRYGI